ATVSCDEPLPVIYAEKSALLQVFQNLIGNALKYARAGVPPLVRIACRERDGGFEFAVQDNGIGIEAEFFDKIFVIFQRLHAKDEYSGTGMGLAIVKKIIDQEGGQLRVESKPGEGSKFYFW